MWLVWADHGWCQRMPWQKAIGRALSSWRERPVKSNELEVHSKKALRINSGLC
jgi:hypothetical protein